MRLGNEGRSSNLEDRRGMGGRMGLGLGGTVVMLVLGLIFGQDVLGDSGCSRESQRRAAA
jgi:hypothetical protein